MKAIPRIFILAAALIAWNAPASRAGPSMQVIVVDDLAFGPAPSGLRVGDVVLWRNRDILRHSATAKDGSFDVDLPPGGAGKITLKRSGEIGYYCRYHPGMKGILVVAP